MKRKCFIFITFLFSLFFFSCQNNTAGVFGFNKADSDFSEYSVYTYSSDNCVNFGSSKSRTIRADSYSLEDLDFYLYGKNTISGTEVFFTKSDGSSTNCLQVNIRSLGDDGSVGVFDISLQNSAYSLYLAAVPSGKSFDKTDIQTNTVLIGNTTIDLRNSNQIHFYLSASQFLNTSMHGSCALYLYTKDWSYSDYDGDDGSSVFRCRVGLYKNNLQKTIVEESNNYILPAYYSNPAGTQRPVPSSFSGFSNHFECTVNAGVYDFAVCIYDVNNPERAYYYSDIIYIYANQNIEKKIEIPNIIMTVPEAPSEMKAGFIDPDSVSSGKYMIDLEWDDNSFTEAYYQLELIETGDSYEGNLDVNHYEYLKTVLGKGVNNSTAAKDAAWLYLQSHYGSTIINNEYFEERGLIADGQVKGSLSRNSNYVMFGLPLGSRYFIRLCAVNSAGKSSYVYPDIYSGTDFLGGANVKVWPWNDSDINESALSMSRYRLIYMLKSNGGSFFDSDDLDNSVYIDVSDLITDFQSVEYKTQLGGSAGTGITLVNPLFVSYNDGLGIKTAKLGQYVEDEFGVGRVNLWQNWKKSYSGGEDISSSYTGYENLTLYPYFSDEIVNNSISFTPYGSVSKTVKTSDPVNGEVFEVVTQEPEGGVPAFAFCLVNGRYSTVDTIELSDSSFTISAAGITDSVISVLVQNPYKGEIFNNIVVRFGKQGGALKDMGAAAGTRTASWSTGLGMVDITHEYWEIPVPATLQKGLYNIYVEATSVDGSKYPYSSFVQMNLTD